MSFLPVLMNDDECVVELRRKRGPRPGLAFLLLWLCIWSAGEFVIGKTLLHSLTGVPRPGKSMEPAAEVFMAALFLFMVGFGVCAIGILIVGFKRKEIWRFTKNTITAGRSWHYFSRRQLVINRSIQVRFGPFAGPPCVDFISAGLLLHLGPFATWELAGEAMGDVERQFPQWQWPSVPDKGLCTPSKSETIVNHQKSAD